MSEGEFSPEESSAVIALGLSDHLKNTFGEDYAKVPPLLQIELCDAVARAVVQEKIRQMDFAKLAGEIFVGIFTGERLDPSPAGLGLTQDEYSRFHPILLQSAKQILSSPLVNEQLSIEKNVYETLSSTISDRLNGFLRSVPPPMRL